MARKKKPRFEVLPAGEMRARHGLTAENRPVIKLNPARVPESLRHLVALAEKFGIGDDLIRADLLARTPADELEAMRAAVGSQWREFNQWLGGPASHEPTPSAEYIAFTCLRMAADGF